MVDENGSDTRLTGQQDQMKSTPRRALPYLPIICGLMTLLCMVMTWRAITAPLVLEEQVTVNSLHQTVTFDYIATPLKSTLYPVPGNLGRQPSYLVKLTDKFQVVVDAKVLAPEEATVEGSYRIVLTLQAEDLWSRDYLLVPERSFSGVGGFTAFRIPVNIPIHEMLSFAAQVGKEAGLVPNSYTLLLKPEVTSKLQATEERTEEEVLVNEFRPLFTFNLTAGQLIPLGLSKERYDQTNDVSSDLVQENAVSDNVLRTQPNSVGFLRASIPVEAARWLYGLITLLLGCMTGWMLATAIRNRPQPSRAGKIQKRYGSRIVEVRRGSLKTGMPTVFLESFKSLLTIADELEKPILHGSNLDEVETHAYYLLEDGVAYCYVIPPGEPEC